MIPGTVNARSRRLPCGQPKVIIQTRSRGEGFRRGIDRPYMGLHWPGGVEGDVHAGTACEGLTKLRIRKSDYSVGPAGDAGPRLHLGSLRQEAVGLSELADDLLRRARVEPS